MTELELNFPLLQIAGQTIAANNKNLPTRREVFIDKPHRIW